MAKDSRYDPRNKKNGKHKSQSVDGYSRIREVSNKDNRKLLQEVVYDDENDYDATENIQLNG